MKEEAASAKREEAQRKARCCPGLILMVSCGSSYRAQNSAQHVVCTQAAEKEAKARVPPCNMFREGEYEAQFGSWDETGVPLTMADGLPLSKAMAKKLQKAREAQEKVHNAWLLGRQGAGAA